MYIKAVPLVYLYGNSVVEKNNIGKGVLLYGLIQVELWFDFMQLKKILVVRVVSLSMKFRKEEIIWMKNMKNLKFLISQ